MTPVVIRRAIINLFTCVLVAAPVVAQTRPSTPPQPTPQTRGAAPSGNNSAAEPNQVLAVQVALDRAGFSPGQLDGKSGKNTESALSAFQQSTGLTPSGQLDAATIERLGEPFQNPLTSYSITAEDAAEAFVANIPEDMVQKAALPSLGYTNVLEMLAERYHSSPALLQQLNPGVRFAQGDAVTVPNVEPFFVAAPAPQTATAAGGDAVRGANRPSAGQGAVARANNPNANAGRAGAASATPASAPTGRKDLVITVTDQTKTLTVTDPSGKVIFYAPVTVGSTKDPLPVGEWKVNGVQWNPPFNYNPDLFWDADPGHSKVKLAPGPNSPVGTVWIDLSKEHYGIHGTPEPGRVGYTESHGCIRLTNWDATRLATLVAPGTKVILR